MGQGQWSVTSLQTVHCGRGVPHRGPLVPRSHGGAGRVGRPVAVGVDDDSRQGGRDDRDRPEKDHCELLKLDADSK